MFGLSFFEILLIAIVGIVVLGPRRLPTMMRTAGQWVAKLRRMSVDLRAQSGIDDLIRQEGLENEIQELRSLSRINVIDTLITPAAGAGAAGAAGAAAQESAPRASVSVPQPKVQRPQPLREREYPTIGCDSYGVLADDIAAKIVAPPRPAVALPLEPAVKPEGSA
ncbi:MAG: Sec-independent protein translocase protein TatB [Polyangiaceae bacterium]